MECPAVPGSELDGVPEIGRIGNVAHHHLRPGWRIVSPDECRDQPAVSDEPLGHGPPDAR